LIGAAGVAGAGGAAAAGAPLIAASLAFGAGSFLNNEVGLPTVVS
jgi:hypothetical protein